MPNHAWNKTKIAQVQEAMRAAPAVTYDPWSGPRPPSKKEVIAVMRDDISAMRDKGYSVEQIAAFLSENGLEIPATLLYQTMRALGAPLWRAAQSVEKRYATANGGLPSMPSSALPVSSSAAAVLAKASANGPELVAVDPRVKKELNKLPRQDRAVFEEALKQLRPGSQLVRLTRETIESNRSLVRSGLLRNAKQKGPFAYEVPVEVASISRARRGATAYRPH